MKEIKFKNITLEDQAVIEFYLQKYSSFCLSAFTFSSLISWGPVYHYQWAVFSNTLLIKLKTLEDKNEHLMQPLGEFPIELQTILIQHATSLDYRLTIYGVSSAFISKHQEFLSDFEQTEHRDMDNYIYSAEDLGLLKGKNYQAKRNLVNQFEANYNWTSESISIANIKDCREVVNKIYSQDDLDSDSYLSHELKALDIILKNYPKFKEDGILIRIDNKPVAFSIFENLNPSTCVVHFEKAIREYKGLYQLVNRETAKQILSKGYKFINREEDLGIEGLRKAKLSYHPLRLCPAYAFVLKKQL